MSRLYRPQFAFRTPPGFRDETFHYAFDSTNVPVLGVGLATQTFKNDISMQMENDAEFVCRGVKIQGTDVSATALNTLNVQIKDPFDNYLSLVPLPCGSYLTGFGQAIIGRLVCLFEPEIVCPAGSRFVAYLFNPTLVTVLPPRFTFFGVKRWPLECAA